MELGLFEEGPPETCRVLSRMYHTVRNVQGPTVGSAGAS